MADELPDFSKVEAIVHRHFVALPGYEKGDLISRSQVEPVFPAIARLGWKVADKKTILRSVLPDRNYLVEEFRTPKGRSFMRKVSGAPLAYDQLDLISQLEGGKLMIQDFLRFPNSELTFTENGPLDLGRLVRLQPQINRARGPTEKDFDRPTGRIYTVEALVARLKKSYQAELERRQRQSK